MQLRTKLTLGMLFLFVMLISFGIMGIFYINRLSNDAEDILKNNHESLVYCNNMVKALDTVPLSADALRLFNDNLSKQETNVTESGERDATVKLRTDFSRLLHNPGDAQSVISLRRSIQTINELNQEAIVRKTVVARTTAADATMWLTIIFTILVLIALSFVVNFPSVISKPVHALAEGIKAVTEKNYQKRIHVKQDDEFGELINAFNIMAEKLDEYEHSSLDKLMFEKTRIETIINQMRDGIIGFDEGKHILFLNEVAQNLLGLQQSEVIGKYGADIAIRNDLMRTLLQQNDSTRLKIYADGKESYFSKEDVTIQRNGAVIGEVIVLRNITPFHELDIAKTNFIATVSHELKTPISSIKMSGSLLKDERVGPLNHEQQELLHGIQDDADRLLKITGELLNMAQVETGNIQLKLQSVIPANIVHEAVEAVQFQAQQKSIALQLQIQQELPSVQADEEKTSWVLINFLTNAIKYSYEGSQIDIAVAAVNGHVRFTVTDHGQGIDDKYLSRIFNRYFKVPGTEKSGTGLGLAISKEFIEAQGGHIQADSTIGKGSRFSFELPAKQI